MTVRDAVAAAVRALVEAGLRPADARRDAAALARHLLGWTLTDWATRQHEPVPEVFPPDLHALTARRCRREPVAYLTGVREFYGRPFRVTRDVLIPRPETEDIVTAALAEAVAFARSPSQTGPNRPLIVDVGTGSGCLAVTLALEWLGARLVASDMSPAALAVARGNAQALGADGIEFAHATLVPQPLPPVSVIVSNPPYVPKRDRDSLPPDVRDYEPAEALFAGDDGLDVIRVLVPAAARALAPGGWLFMEIGVGQADAVRRIAADAGLAIDAIRPDLAGIPRVVVARRPPAP